MNKRITDVKVIGLGLAILYALSFVIYLEYSRVPDLQLMTFPFAVLYGTIFLSSLFVLTLNEWGRQLIVVLNVIMFIFLLGHFIAKIGFVHVSYIFMNIVVLLYFNQSKVKLQFRRRNVGSLRSLLVVDDDENFLTSMKHLLMSYGFSVLTALTGEEALRIAQTQKPELILLDVILPGIKGREVCKKVKEDPTTKDIPVVFVTSQATEDSIQAEMQAGAAAHLTKPVKTKDLLLTITKLMKIKY